MWHLILIGILMLLIWTSLPFRHSAASMLKPKLRQKTHGTLGNFAVKNMLKSGLHNNSTFTVLLWHYAELKGVYPLSFWEAILAESRLGSKILSDKRQGFTCSTLLQPSGCWGRHCVAPAPPLLKHGKGAACSRKLSFRFCLAGRKLRHSKFWTASCIPLLWKFPEPAPRQEEKPNDGLHNSKNQR